MTPQIRTLLEDGEVLVARLNGDAFWDGDAQTHEIAVTPLRSVHEVRFGMAQKLLSTTCGLRSNP